MFDYGASHLFIAASYVKNLGLEDETLEKSLHVSSPLGTRVSFDKICQDCELEISGILLTMDLRVIGMSEFDVILGMDWLTGDQVIIDCDHMRVTVYTLDNVCVMFQGDKHDALPQVMYDSRWHGKLIGLLASLTLEDEARQELGLPRVVYKYEDVFLDELPGLPLQRDVNFTIKLHPGTSPISMIPHRMAPTELQELKVQLQELLDRGFIRLSTSPWGCFGVVFQEERQDP